MSVNSIMKKKYIFPFLLDSICMFRPVVAQGHKRSTVKAIGYAFNSHLKMWIIVYFDMFSFKVGNWIILMGTECLNTRFLGSLCLHFYVRDTA